MPNIELIGRVADVTVGTMKVSGHRCAFSVRKTLKPEPNDCSLSIWNLSESQRSQLEELKPKKGALRGIPCRIEAGYKDAVSQIWLGDLRDVSSVREGTDWVTNLQAGDGEKAIAGSRISQTFGPGTSIDTAIRAMVRELGVGEGNVASVVAKLRISGVGKLLAQGVVVSGPTARKLTDWCRSADLEWSIQDSAVQFVSRGKVLVATALRLNSASGLVGSPTVDSDGVLEVTFLMIPDVRVGTLLVMDAERVKGNYRIEEAVWTGDTFGQDWYITAKASRY